jgi:hypothetical protein
MAKEKKPTIKTIYLKWDRVAENGQSHIEVALHIMGSVNADKKIGDAHYICNKCDTQLSQSYKCVCGEELTVSQIEKRVDGTTIYYNKDKKKFMELTVDENIKVIKEITSKDVIDQIELIEKPFELYNNDTPKQQATMKSIHNFLNQKDIVLMVEFGIKGEEYGGFIISTKDKILLYALRDARLIKDTQQIGLETRANPHTETLKAITESKKPALYEAFIEAVEEAKKNKTEIKMPVARKEEEIVETEIEFLKGF